MNFSQSFLRLCATAASSISDQDIEAVASILSDVRARGGRLFLVGSGGGAGHASHAVCDFRKLCDIEAYAPYDNVSELTARVNDEGWETTISNWLRVSKLKSSDCVFVFSVGGGNSEKNVSMNLVNAVDFAKRVGASVVGIVGKDGGYTKRVGDAVVVIPTVDSGLITPMTEGFQALVWHLLVSHPKLQLNPTKWESISDPAAQTIAMAPNSIPVNSK
jgi:D-sedoheptulose 7-phosphate isomerase